MGITFPSRRVFFGQCLTCHCLKESTSLSDSSCATWSTGVCCSSLEPSVRSTLECYRGLLWLFRRCTSTCLWCVSGVSSPLKLFIAIFFDDLGPLEPDMIYCKKWRCHPLDHSSLFLLVYRLF